MDLLKKLEEKRFYDKEEKTILDEYYRKIKKINREFFWTALIMTIVFLLLVSLEYIYVDEIENFFYNN